MAVLRLDKAIESVEELDDVKIILRQLTSAVNTLSEAKNKMRGDVVIKDPAKGMVLRGPSGEYFRVTIEDLSPTNITLTNLGKGEPTGE